MPWVDGRDWVDGDYCTEQRLDEDQGNADFMREEARHRIGAQITGVTLTAPSGFDWHFARLRMTLGGNTIQTSYIENPIGGAVEWPALPRNVALSGLSNGTVYDLDIFLDLDTAAGGGSVTAYQIGRASVFVTEDLGYFSAFGKISSGLSGATVTRLAVILTRDDEAL